MNGIHPCQACDGDGFVFHRCGCREAMCEHESAFGRGDGTEATEGLYGKYWVRRIDGSSHEGQKHHACEYFVLDWQHDPFSVLAALAYAAACEATVPELAHDLRVRAVYHGERWLTVRPKNVQAGLALQMRAQLDAFAERMAGRGDAR